MKLRRNFLTPTWKIKNGSSEILCDDLIVESKKS